jgi:polysaccharide export outer membrane protein
MPLLSDVQAEGLTPDQLAHNLTEGLKGPLRDPIVIVTVTASNSKMYSIAGVVPSSGTYSMGTPTGILDALRAAGLRDGADQREIVIMRGDQRLTFDYNDLLKGETLYIQPGDRIIVK